MGLGNEHFGLHDLGALAVILIGVVAISRAKADDASVQGLDRKGLSIAASVSYSWGLMPLYWHLLKDVPAADRRASRWSAALVALWLLWWSRGAAGSRRSSPKPRLAAMLTLSGLYRDQLGPVHLV